MQRRLRRDHGGGLQRSLRGRRADDRRNLQGVQPPRRKSLCSQEISTPSLLARLDKLVHLGDAFLVLPGGTGTLLELALVWELLNKRLIGRQTPLILLGDFWAPLIPLILSQQPEALRPQVAPTVEAAVALLAAHFEGRPGTP